MRHLLSIVLSWLVLLAPAFAQNPIIFASKKGLVRSGLQGAWSTPGASGQAITNLVSGGAAMQRGTTSGTDASDPSIVATGLSFDGSDDRVSNFPAKGSAWTITNCSGSECYSKDSAGAEYVNGAAIVNRLKWSSDLSNAAWAKAAAGTGVTPVVTLSPGSAPDGSNAWRLQLNIGAGSTVSDYSVFSQTTSAPTVAQSMSVYAKSNTGSSYLVAIRNSNVASGSIGSWQTYTITPSSWSRIYISGTPATASPQYQILLRGTYGTSSNADILIWNPQLDYYATPAPYQKTEAATEFAVETAGGYTGTLSFLGRWTRVLNPAEVRRNYATYLKPAINAAGGTLP